MTGKEEHRPHFVYWAIFFEVVLVVLAWVFLGYDRSLTEMHRYPMYQDVHVMVFIGFGFLMTFLHKYAVGSISFTLLVGALTIQWALIVQGFWARVFVQGAFNHVVDISFVNLLNADFAAAAVLISFGAVIGRISSSQILAMVFFEVIFYALNEQVLLHTLKVTDFGGTMVIHLFGAYFGLAFSWVHGVVNRERYKDIKITVSRHNDTFSMIGTVFLFIYWLSFNGALATGAVQNRAVVNTLISICGSVCTAFIVSRVIHGKFDMSDIQNATLAGGVCMGVSSSLILYPGGALLVGLVCGAISSYGYGSVTSWMQSKLGIRDTCGVNNLHGMPSIIGSVAAAIAAATSTYVPADLNQMFPLAASIGRTSMSELGGYQAIAMAVAFCIAVGGGLFTGFITTFSIFDPMKEKFMEDASEWHISNPETDVESGKITEEKIDAMVTELLKRRKHTKTDEIAPADVTIDVSKKEDTAVAAPTISEESHLVTEKL